MVCDLWMELKKYDGTSFKSIVKAKVSAIIIFIVFLKINEETFGLGPKKVYRDLMGHSSLIIPKKKA
jgi:hypothetical protein